MKKALLCRSLVIAVGVVGLLLLTRCGIVTTGPASGTFGNVYAIFQSANCTQCHAPNGGSAATNDGTQIDFTTQTTAFNTLVGTGTPPKVHGNSSIGQCGAVTLVKASNPSQSYLPYLFSFTGYTSPAFTGAGSCVPYSGHSVNLTAAEQTSILNWITNGAKND